MFLHPSPWGYWQPRVLWPEPILCPKFYNYPLHGWMGDVSSTRDLVLGKLVDPVLVNPLAMHTAVSNMLSEDGDE